MDKPQSTFEKIVINDKLLNFMSKQKVVNFDRAKGLLARKRSLIIKAKRALKQ